HNFRKLIEDIAVDHVAEWIAEQALLEIEITERTALVVARTALGERRGKRRYPGDVIHQLRLIGEQHASHQGLDVRSELRAGAPYARLPADAGQQVGHTRLVFQRHQSDYVAIGTQVWRGVEFLGQVRDVLG